MARLTLEQVAELAGVSRSTVSRVINHQASVKPEVRDRVWQVIEETGYQPHPAARKLAGQKSGIMGLVIPETAQILFSDPYFPRLIQGVTQACNAHDYTLSLFLFHTEADERKLSARIMGNPLLDGLIIVATSIDDLFVPELQKTEIPFVQIGQMRGSDLHYVDTDNEAGAYTAVAHLLRIGRQRIATITGPQDNHAAIARKLGYINALQDRGQAINTNLIVRGDFTEQSGYAGMMALLPYQPDAVFVASDTMALGALRALQETETAVPDQVALVGYDDLPMAAQANPPLTTLRQPIKRLGIVAVETLLDILDNGAVPTRRVIMPNELVIRASCGMGA